MSRQALSTRILLILALVFFVVSLLNAFIAIKIILPTAKVALGYVLACFKHGPTLEINESFSLFDGDNFTLYVNYTNPDNRTIEFYDNTSIFDINTFTGLINFSANASNTGNYSVKIILAELNGFCGNTVLTRVSSFVITGNSSLLIWDYIDPRGGNHLIHVDQTMWFFANYSNSIGAPINGSSVYCNISFYRNVTYSTPVNMYYNSTTSLYYYNTSFAANGNYSYHVDCHGMSKFFLDRNATDDFVIANNPPVLVRNLPNETWNMNTILISIRLDDYFIDPDGDKLTYTATMVPNIQIIIDNITSRITYRPDANWYGNRSVIFRATDPYGLYAESNIVFLEVVYVQPPAPPNIPTPSATGGGGGGGGGAMPCEEVWDCSPWGPCLPNGIRTRKCADLALCDTDLLKPNESEICGYWPTCSDNILNDNETGVDCGGPCPPCPNCSDNIQNQNEEGIDCGGPCPVKCPTCEDGFQNGGETSIDCGGPCKPCTSCYDGIKNQGEEDIDCGGPCKPCAKVLMPAKGRSVLFYISAFLATLLILIAVIFLAVYIAERLKKPVPKAPKPELTIEELLEQTLKRLQILRRRLATEDALVIRDSLLDIMHSFILRYAKFETEIAFEELPEKTATLKEIFTPKLMQLLLILAKKYSEIGYKGDVAKEELNALISDSINFVSLCAKYSAELKTKEALELFQTQLPVLESMLKLNNMRVSRQIYTRLAKVYVNLPQKQKLAYHKRLSEAHDNLLEVIKSYKKK